MPAVTSNLMKVDTAQRVARLQASMKEQDVDVCLAMRPGTAAYFLDVQIAYRTILAVPQSGEPFAVYWHLDAARLSHDAWPTDVYVWGHEKEGGFRAPNAFAVLGEILESRGWHAGRIAVEFAIGQERTAPGLLLAFEEPLLRRALPDAELVNASAVIDPVLQVKDEAEMDLLREAGRVAEAALRAGFAAIEPGVTEPEVAGVVHCEFGKRQAAPWPAAPTEVISGPRTTYPQNITTYLSERQIEHGDMVLIDLHPLFRNHISDLCVPSVVGKPNRAQRELIATWERVVDGLVGDLKPGARIGSIAERAQQRLRDSGYEEFAVHGFFGHGLGTCTRVPPIIRPGSGAELPEGTVVVAGCHIYQPGVGGCRLEYPVFVGRGGPEPLCGVEPKVHVL